MIGVFHFVFPDLGVGFGEAAELPVVTDECIEVVTLLGGGVGNAPCIRR